MYSPTAGVYKNLLVLPTPLVYVFAQKGECRSIVETCPGQVRRVTVFPHADMSMTWVSSMTTN
jgi:hypothetical protein